MSLFILTFFALYGGVHLYVFLRARAALAFSAPVGAAVAAFMLFMTLCPFLIRILEQNEYELSAQALSFIAYVWMAAVFLFFCASLALEAVNLPLHVAGWAARGSWSRFAIPDRSSFLLAVVTAFGICVYGYFSALDITTERMTIETAKLPAGVDRFKIVQISDVHLGLIVREARLRKVLALVEAEKPDLFVSTGDLVDAQIDHMAGMAELLRQVKAPAGKYAVTGNHEYYAGISQAVGFTREAGFTMLRGEARTGQAITVVGVDDPTVLQLKRDPREEELLSKLPKDRFILLLKHRPAIEQKSVGLFDLQLSGHTHHGQIYPFRYIAEMAYPMNAGRFDLAKGSILRVSRGTGTWGPPIRFLSPPEVTVIELVRKETK